MALIIPQDQDEDYVCKQYHCVNWRRDTLVDMVQQCASFSPFLTIYTLLDEDCQLDKTLTSQQLDHQASMIAAGLHHFGKEQDRVLILCDNDFNYILAFYGCLYANMIAVSGVHVNVIRSDERFKAVFNDSQPNLVIGPRYLLAEFKKYVTDLSSNSMWVPLETLLNSKNKLVKKGENKDVALIQYTSGTTKGIKGIILTHRNMLYNIHNQPASNKILVNNYHNNYHGLSWLPFAHDMGLIGGILAPVGLRTKVYLLPPKYFIEKPIRWLQAITYYKLQVSGGPTFAYNLCLKEVTDEEYKNLDLSSWEIAVNSADNTQINVMVNFYKKFADVGFRAKSFNCAYGLAEATLTVTNTPIQVSPKIRSFSRRALMAGFAKLAVDVNDQYTLVSCGHSCEGQKVVIVNPETSERLRNGQIGEIWVSGISVGKGYFNQPKETKETFHAKLAGSSENSETYLRTGDLGFFYENELYFSGRMSNVITLRNKKYDPAVISSTLENNCVDIHVNSTAFFLCNSDDPKSVTIVVEINRNPVNSYELIAEQIYKHITKIYDLWPQMIVLTRLGGVLKTPSGKIQMNKTRIALQEGKLPVIQEFRYDVPEITPLLSFENAYKQVEDWVLYVTKDWKENVKKLTRQKLVQREINPDLLLDLRKKFELQFHVEIDPSEFTFACETYTDLCNLLAKKISDSELQDN